MFQLVVTAPDGRNLVYDSARPAEEFSRVLEAHFLRGRVISIPGLFLMVRPVMSGWREEMRDLSTKNSAEIRDVVEVEIWEDREITLTLLFDPEHALDERIAMEQFVT